MAFLIESEQVQDILPLAEECFAEFKYPGRFNPAHFQKFWESQISEGGGNILVALAEQEIGGIMGFVIGQDQFSGAPICMVNWWFVPARFRNRGLGKQLLHDMESLSKFYGIHRILMGSPVGFEKFFQTEGYTPIEIGFQKVL